MNISIYKHTQLTANGLPDWSLWSRRVSITTALVLLVLMVLPGLLQIGGFEMVSVNGGSMAQAVPDGSLVITRLADGNSLQTDDVVVFTAGWLEPGIEQISVVHRLALIVPTPEGLIGYTAGDANMLADPGPLSLRGELSLVQIVLPFVGKFYSVPSRVIFFIVTGMFLAGIRLRRPKFSRPNPTSFVQLNENGLAVA